MVAAIIVTGSAAAFVIGRENETKEPGLPQNVDIILTRSGFHSFTMMTGIEE